jgi:hypothetical protein
MNPISEVLARSAWEFKNMGVDYVAYIKPDHNDDGLNFGVYTADGECLGVKNTFDSAAKLAENNDLQPLRVH